MLVVKSEELYSPQAYLEAVTGKCYIVNADTICELLEEMQQRLYDNGHGSLWDFPLTGIDEIVEDNLDVVLVELTGDDENGKWVTIYRWFEVPEQFPVEDGEER